MITHYKSNFYDKYDVEIDGYSVCPPTFVCIKEVNPNFIQIQFLVSVQIGTLSKIMFPFYNC